MVRLVRFIEEIKQLNTGEEGTALTEVGLLLFFIAIVAVLALQALGDRVSAMYESAVGLFQGLT